MTNLDKIRNMPAEDLAEYLINFNRCSKCVHYNKEEFECGYLETPVPCIDGVTKWLEQERNPMPDIQIVDCIFTHINEIPVMLVVLSDKHASNLHGVMVRWQELKDVWKIKRINDEKECVEVIWEADNE